MGSENGLFEGYRPAFNEGAPRDFAAQMLYNAIFATTINYRDGVASKVGDDNKDNKTIGERDLNLIQKTAVFAGNDKFSLTTTAGRDQSRLTPVDKYQDYDKDEYLYADATISFDVSMSLLGQEVKVLYKTAKSTNSNKNQSYADPDINSVVYGVTATGKTAAYDVTKGDMDDEDSDKLDLGKEFGKVKVADTVEVFYNYRDESNAKFTFTTKGTGSAANSAKVLTRGTSDTNIKDENGKTFPGLKADSSDKIEFVTNNDGKIRYAFVTEKVYAKVSNLTSDKITFVGGKAIDLDGADIYSGVAKDDIAAVTVLYKAYKDMDDDDAEVTATKVDTVEGTVTSLAGTNNKKIKIGDTTYTAWEAAKTLAASGNTQLGTSEDYKLAEKIASSDTPQADDLDETYTLFTDGGFWFAYLNTAGTVKNYAVVTGADKNGLEDRVKLMDADGNEKTYAIDDDSEVKLKSLGSSKFGFTNKGSAVTYADGTKSDATEIIGHLFRYSVTSTGDVKLKRDEKIQNISASGVTFDDNGKLFANKATADNAVAFVNYYKETEATKQKWDAFAVNDMDEYGTKNKPLYATADYAISGNDVIAFVMSSKTEGKPGSSNKADYGYVVKDPEVVTVNGDKYTQLTVWNGTEDIVIKVDDNGDATNKNDSNYTKKRDFISYELGSNGIVDEADFYSMGNGNDDGYRMTAAALYDYKSGRNSMQVYDDPANKNSLTTGLGVMDDVKVIFVNVDDGKGVSAGSPTSSTWDSEKYPLNIVFQMVEDDGKGKVAVIFVDTDNDITVDGNQYTNDLKANGRLKNFDATEFGGSANVPGDVDNATAVAFDKAVASAKDDGTAGVAKGEDGVLNGKIAVAGLENQLKPANIGGLETTIEGYFTTGLAAGAKDAKVNADKKQVTVVIGTGDAAKTMVFDLVEAYAAVTSLNLTVPTSGAKATIDDVKAAFAKLPGVTSVLEIYTTNNGDVAAASDATWTGSDPANTVTSITNLHVAYKTTTGAVNDYESGANVGAGRQAIGTLVIAVEEAPEKASLNSSKNEIAPSADDVFAGTVPTIDKTSVVLTDVVKVVVPMVNNNTTGKEFKVELFASDDSSLGSVQVPNDTRKKNLEFSITVNAGNKALLDGMYIKITTQAAAVTQTTVYVDTTAVNGFAPSLASPVQAPTTVGGSGKITLTGTIAVGDPIYAEYKVAETNETGSLSGVASTANTVDLNFSGIGKNATSATTTIQLTKVVTAHVDVASSGLTVSNVALNSDGTKVTFKITGGIPAGATLKELTGATVTDETAFEVEAPVAATIGLTNAKYTIPYKVQAAATVGTDYTINGVTCTSGTDNIDSGNLEITMTAGAYSVSGTLPTLKMTKASTWASEALVVTATTSGGGLTTTPATTNMNTDAGTTEKTLTNATITAVTGATTDLILTVSI